MKPLACPQCGAPIQGAISGPYYTCPFCRQTSESPRAPEAPRTPQFVIIQGPTSDPTPRHISIAPSGGAAGRGCLSLIVPIMVPILIVSVVLLANFGSQLKSLTGIGAWNGSEPLVCGGNDSVDVSGVTATFNQGSAIIARGNCRVTLTNCSVKAAVGIEAGSNAHVIVKGGSVQGTTAAVDASANATVDLLGNVKTSGPLKRSGNAHVTGVTGR